MRSRSASALLFLALGLGLEGCRHNPGNAGGQSGNLPPVRLGQSGTTGNPTSTTSPAPLPSLPDQLGALEVPNQVFPATDAWNQDVSTLPVLAKSATYLASMGLRTPLHPDFGAPRKGLPFGIPYIVIGDDVPLVPVQFELYVHESNPGPYPLPANLPIEGVAPGSPPPTMGAGDQHAIVVDRSHLKLYELWEANPPNNPSSRYPTRSCWSADNGAVWDLTRPCTGQRPSHWASADAAGLPIFPGLVRYEEVVTRGVLNHALRVTVNSSQDGFFAPANHAAGANNPALPPMGLRLRLKANYKIAPTLPQEVQVLLTGLKRYGMIVADYGGSWFLSGAPDNRWNDARLNALSVVHGSDFECVDTGAQLQR